MQRFPWWIAWLLLCTLGCAAGPFEELAWLNPVHRQEWAKDDGDVNNYHNRIEEYRTLAGTIGRMTPQRQDTLAQDLSLELEHEADPLYRIEIVRALGNSSSAAAESGLRRGIKDASSNVRIASCVAWRKRGGPAAGKVLSETVVSDTDRHVRIAAARSLGDLKDPTTMRSLGLAMEVDDPAMQFACVESLKKISGKDYGSNLSAWQELAEGGTPSQEYEAKPRGMGAIFTRGAASASAEPNNELSMEELPPLDDAP